MAERALGIEAVEEAVVVRQLPRTRANPVAVETNIALTNADRMLAWVADGLHVDTARTAGDRKGHETRPTADKCRGRRDQETSENRLAHTNPA